MILILMFIGTGTLYSFIALMGAIIDKDYKKAALALVFTIGLTVGSWWSWTVTNDNHDQARYNIYEERLQTLRKSEQVGQKKLQAKILELEEEQAIIVANMKNRRELFPWRLFY